MSETFNTPEQFKKRNTHPNQNAGSGNLQNIGRRGILKGLSGMGLLAAITNACKPKGQYENSYRVPENFIDLRSVEPLPEDEQGREYDECPEITPEHIDKFFERMKNFFPLDLSKIFIAGKKTEQTFAFLRKSYGNDLKSEVEQQLSQFSKDYQILECNTLGTHLVIEFRLNGINYTLKLTNDFTIDLQVGAETQNIKLFYNALILDSPSKTKYRDETSVVRRDIQLLQTGLGTTVTNTGNQTVHIETEDMDFDIFDTDSFLNFLRQNKDKLLYAMSSHLFPQQVIEDIGSIDEVIEIIKYLPKGDIGSYIGTYSDFIDYAAKDTSAEDEFRNPIDTLKSHWGDCDDFAQINGLWAKLNGYNAELIFLDPKPDSDNEKGHVFVHAKKGAEILIMDNDTYTKNVPLEEYMENYNEKFIVDGNIPLQ